MILDLSMTILLMNLATTFFMIGVIAFVQVVHYLLMARIPPGSVPSYEQEHAR